jgi:hypothetical protein
MALVLLMEGTNQFISFRHIVEYTNNIFKPINDMYPGETDDKYVQMFNDTINDILNNQYLGVTEDVYDNVTSDFSRLVSTPNITVTDAENIVDNILVDLLKLIFDGYGFEAPESQIEGDNFEAINAVYYGVFKLVFGYFFISAGTVLILLGVLSWLSHSKGLHESRSHLVGIISKLVIGISLVFCSMMVLTNAANNLGESAWTLPLLSFLLAIALVLNHIPWGNLGNSTARSSRQIPTGNRGSRGVL